jgi:hypothetical protein
MLRILWGIWGRLWIGFNDGCPAGRAHYVWGGHFVACVPVLRDDLLWALPLVGNYEPDQREGDSHLYGKTT